MRVPMQMYRDMQPLVRIPGFINMQVLNNIPSPTPREKVIFVMGATGTGKSRLSIELAAQFPAEIINSDKIQVYKGLDIVTNKVTEEEQRGVQHHLLSTLDPDYPDFTAKDFCRMASHAVESILGRRKLPIIVGGSNSFIEAMVDDKSHGFRSKYDCCFLWVDVSVPVLYSFLSKRVDKMVEAGMVKEVRDFFSPNADYSQGIRRAIGVPEFDHYLRNEPFPDDEDKARLLEQAINEVKDNTCNLACRQLEKIHQLRNYKGWNMHRLDATDAFRKQGKEADEAWHELVARPSMTILWHFLDNFSSPFYATDLATITLLKN
ncbi:hypothetical protein Ancab_019438 [Ancistrocladus abbreviatus]